MSMIDEESLTAPATAAELTRRGLIKGMGFVAVGITLASCAPSSEPKTLLGKADRDITQVDAWIAIGADETVTLFSSRIDNGHGTMTGLLQIMADELDAPFANTRAVFGDTTLTPDDGGTGASDGIQLHGVHVREAAATARAGLMELAARKLGVPADQLTVNDGVVSVVGQAGKSISYGKLIGGQQINLKVNKAVKPKSPKDYKVVGKPIPRIDLVKKVTCEAEWLGDIRLPGMLHARAVRTTGWSTVPDQILSIDESSVAGMPGLVKVVRVDVPEPVNTSGPQKHGEGVESVGFRHHFVGVICEREEQAVAAAEKLQVSWAKPPALPEDLHADLANRVSEVQTTGNGGDVDAGFAGAAKTFASTYKTPSHLHSPIMPAMTVADVKVVDGKVESARLWVSAQRVGLLRTAVGRVLEIPEAEIPARVRITYVYGAGTFGTGNGNTVNAVDAAMLSKAVNRPVRLQWTREQQHGFDLAWPLQMFNLKAGVDAKNEICAYSYEHIGDHKFLDKGPAKAPTGEVYYDGSLYDFAQGAANYRLVSRMGTPLFPHSYMRSPTSFPAFAVESFIDELAAATKQDPIAFRLKHLAPPKGDEGLRTKELLDKLAKKAGWKARPSPNPANAGVTKGAVRGRGMAYAHADYEHNLAATVVDVEVDLESGQVKILRIVAALDGGLIINPLLATDQVEGASLQAAGRALYEERHTDGFRIAKQDWNDYPILRFDNVPAIESVLVNRPELPAGAYGEAAANPLFAAIGNAIFDAIGVRLYEMPFTPERVLAAIASGRQASKPRRQG